ncbi:cytochrome P450 2K1-like isoform X2 [Lissotriton helveticus]
MYPTGFFIVLLIILFIFITVKSTTDAWKRSIANNFPPGPRPLPLIGNLHLLDLRRPQKTFIELSKKYGSVFSIQLGMKKMVVLTGYETVKDALVNHPDEFGERAHIPILEDINNGFGFSHGENWKIMRRFTLLSLRDFGMGKKTIEDKIREESQFLTKYFQSHDGKPFDVTNIMNFAVANIIISIVLGHRFDYHHPTLLMLTQIVTENLRLTGTPMVNLYNIYPALIFLPGNHKTVHQNIKDMHSFLRKTFLTSRIELNSDDKRNLLEAFLIKEKEEKTNPNSYFHERNLLCVVTSLFTAGTDTTSSTLRWGCLLMMKYPDIQRKVQEEIDRVIDSEQPRTGHRKLMPYTDAVIHEIQRFGNILPLGLARETTVDTNFKGYFIPKGTHIIPLLEPVLYDKTQFAKPEEFNPQHFLDSEGMFVKNEALMNFGAGRRICIGQSLARMELFLFFTSLLQRCTLELPPGVTHIDLSPSVGFTTPPKPYEICALPRC